MAPITLNVGGTKFQTTRQTILKAPEGYLATLLDDEGQHEHFVDRDPTYFNYILNALRGACVMPKDELAQRSIKVEADFYGVRDLLAPIDTRHRRAELFKRRQFYLTPENGFDVGIQWRTLLGSQTLEQMYEAGNATFIGVLNELVYAGCDCTVICDKDKNLKNYAMVLEPLYTVSWMLADFMKIPHSVKIPNVIDFLVQYLKFYGKTENLLIDDQTLNLNNKLKSLMILSPDQETLDLSPLTVKLQFNHHFS